MLAQRLLSAAVGIPLLILIVYLGGAVYTAAAAAILAVAALEFQHIQHEWLSPVSVLTAVMVGGIAVGAYAGGVIWLAWLGGGLALACLAAVLQAEPPQRLADTLWTMAAITYCGFLGSFIVLLRFIDLDGREWVYIALAATFANDTAAYFVGRAIGHRPLAPAISPKKTVEGFLGGYIAGFAVVVGLNFVMDLGVPVGQIVLLALLLPPVATVGDLAESAVKRATGIKDASELIPGHGGFLDRLDSILFVFAAVYFFTQTVVY